MYRIIWRWYYLTVVDHKNYILQYTPEIWNGIGNYHFEIFSFNQKGQKEILETQELPYDSIHTSEDNKQDLLIKTHLRYNRNYSILLFFSRT